MTAPYLAIIVGVLSASAASILFKFAQAEPLVIAFYRLAFSTVILAFALLWRKWEWISPRDLLLSIVSGFFLAAHFAAWFFSLTLTSIASSTVLVSTHPFLVLLFAYIMWNERPERKQLGGVALAVIGALLVGWGDFGLDVRALRGDLLAFLGAVAVTGYLLIGKSVRQRVGAIQYSTLAYASASLTLIAFASVVANPLIGFPTSTWWVFLGLAVFPTIFGHTLFNWALKYVPPSVVSVTILGEPIGATILAWVIWRTGPGPVSLAGGCLLLLGIGFFQYATVRPKT